MTTDHDKLNKRIAERLGWINSPEGWVHPTTRCRMPGYGLELNFHTDANAALEAARVIVGDYTLRCCNGRHIAQDDRPDRQRPEHPADTAHLALCALLEAVMDEEAGDE